jgi:Mg2+-importing ATPase
LLSSVFDFATFGVLLLVYRAAPVEFRTAWFVESLLTELVIALVVRTRRPFFRSRPGRFLLWSTAATVAVTFALPYSPLARPLGFAPLPPVLVALIVAITVGYVIAAESLKRTFFRGDAHGLPRPPGTAQVLPEPRASSV